MALYFAWLGLYTRFLTYPMVMGMLTMIGYQIPGWGTDSNRFALAYSVFLSLWSTLFLESWTRYENELKFRWGTNREMKDVARLCRFKTYLCHDKLETTTGN